MSTPPPAGRASARVNPTRQDDRQIVVLESFRAPRPSTNPFLTQLHDSLAGLADVHYFSWRRALLGRFDVLHVHWPELLIRGRTPARSAVRRLLVVALLLRIRWGHRAIVRTLHNVTPHEHGDVTERGLLRLCDRWTTVWITLVPHSETPSGAPSVTILHGHYADWFAGYEIPSPHPGRLLYFGLIRRYKGVAELVEVFGCGDDPAMSLRIVGRAAEPSLADVISRACTADQRISAVLDYVDDARLAREVGEAELVVLPYREMHNSGSVLLALSLARPILVPCSPITAALSAEVGPGWVFSYEPPLTLDALRAALATSRATPRAAAPNLASRDWKRIGHEHLDAYRLARQRAARRPRAGDGAIAAM